MRLLAVLHSILLLGAAASSSGRTALFVSGVSGGRGLDSTYQADATLLRGNPDTPPGQTVLFELYNWGSAPFLLAGRLQDRVARTVLRFPLASLAGQYRRISGARLVLTLRYPAIYDFENPKLHVPLTFSLYRIAPSNADWNEGTSTVGSEVQDAVCWAWRKSPVTSWAGGKGCSVAGLDYDEDPVSSATLTTLTWPMGQHLVFEIKDTALIEDWINHPASNAGLLLCARAPESLSILDKALIQFDSDDVPTPVTRPRLEVDFDTLPDETLAAAPFQAGVAERNPATSYDTMAATFFEGDSDGCYGNAPELRVGVESHNAETQLWRSSLKFDLSAMSDLAFSIRALRLTLTVQSTLSDGQTLNAFHLLRLDRIAPANASWHESSTTWGWLAKNLVPWAGGHSLGAGLQVADVDYVSQPLASVIVVPSELHEGDRLTFEAPAALYLSHWILRPEVNAGLRLSCPTLENAAAGAYGQILFYSDDTAQPSLRPRLELLYSTTPHSSGADPAWLTLR